MAGHDSAAAGPAVSRGKAEDGWGALRVALVGIGCWIALGACKVETHTETYSFGPRCKPQNESCVDALTARLCDGSELATFRCRGPEGCRERPTEPKPVYCDRSTAREGERCLAARGHEVVHACSEDGRARLACVGGAWIQQSECHRCFHKKRDTAIPHAPTFTVECE